MIDFSKQLAGGIAAAEGIKVTGQFERVVFCGMGGSAIPGEMISMLWLDNFNCYLQRGFGLPHWVSRKCLVVCTSWSGNTRETISSFKAARELGIPAVAITKGGELANIAREHGALLIKLPDDPAPSRLGVGYMLASLLTLLNDSAIIDFKLPTKPETPNEVGPSFSSRIADKIPLIYSSYQWRYLARFWKINFNEGCKIHSFSNYFPEAAHNELAGFAVPVPKLNLPLAPSAFGNAVGTLKPFPIILIDRDEERVDIIRLEKFASFLKGQKIDHETIEIDGQSRLEKILNNYNLAVSVSFELAKSLGVNPLDDSTIENFKRT